MRHCEAANVGAPLMAPKGAINRAPTLAGPLAMTGAERLRNGFTYDLSSANFLTLPSPPWGRRQG